MRRFGLYKKFPSGFESILFFFSRKGALIEMFLKKKKKGKNFSSESLLFTYMSVLPISSTLPSSSRSCLFLWHHCFHIICTYVILYIWIKIKEPQMRKHMMFIFNRWEPYTGLFFRHSKNSTFLSFTFYQDSLKFCGIVQVSFSFCFSILKNFCLIQRGPSLLHYFITLYENIEI